MTEGSPGERRLAAILSADAVGYTRLMADDEAATVRSIKACRALIGERVANYRGRVVDSPGDNLLALFPSALDATRCALEVQDALAAANQELPEERRMTFRIGLHLGDVLADETGAYGEGVNLAARLEALALPGGLCLSAPVHDQIRGKVECAFEDLGERELKGVASPVRAYRVGGEAAPGAGPTGAASERPAIAVLPFTSLSPDRESELFADAVAADLITLLSAWRAFPVIARGSSFTYRESSVDAKRAGRELGARYLVEGTVRAAGGRVRVTAQLVDATNGHQVWGQKYDRPMDELFDVQDEVVEAIVSALQPAVRVAEAERARRAPTDSLAAWALTNRAWTAVQSDLVNAKVRDEARADLERALELDPDYALAHAALALTLALGLEGADAERFREGQTPVLEHANRALALAPDDPQVLQVHGATMGNLGRTDDGTRALARSLELDPGNAQARAAYGINLIFKGRAPEGLAHIDQARQLSPRDPLLYNWLAFRALAALVLDRHDEALADATAAVDRRPTRIGLLARALALGQVGRIDEGVLARRELERYAPGLTIAQLEPSLRQIGRSDQDLERFVALLRRVGFS